MSIYEEVLENFFNELKSDDQFPSKIRNNLEKMLKEGKITSDDIIDIIKKGGI